MRILSVKLENFCQHRSLEFQLAPGLNAIVGGNGSGKSNALKAIYGALTNDFSRNEGQKDKNICQLAGPKERSSIFVSFEHQGAEYQLTRNLRPNTQKFQVPGEMEITRDTLVNQRVSQIVGVTGEILDNYIFVDQWAIFDFLTATEAKRAQAFQRLFGTTDAEKSWAAVGEVLSRTEVPQVLADIDGQRLALSQAEARVAQIEQDLAQYADLPERPDPNSSDRAAVRGAHRRVQLDADILRSEQMIARWNVDLVAAKREQAAFQSDRDSLRLGAEGIRSNVEAARAALANWNTLKTVQSARARVELQLERARSEAVLQVRPAKCGLYVSDLDAAFHERHAFLKGEIGRAEAFVKSFDPASGCAECPTCFTPATNLWPAVAEAQSVLPGLKSELAEMDSRLEYSARIDREEREYLNWHNAWKPRVAALERQLAELHVINRPEHTEEALNAIVAESRELEVALREVEAELESINQSVAVTQGKISGEQGHLNAYLAERQALRLYSPEDLAEIEQRIAQQTVAFQTRAQLRGELQAEQRHRQGFESSIRALEVQKAEAERTHRWVQHLGDVRAVLHRESLPRIVAQHYLRELQVDTNSFLDTFEAPFRVEADDKLSFKALYHDGREQPAGRLSGGEKVVLALAFRLSVNSMFAQDVGLLCLDEPTVGLDEHNLGCLQTALERLKELSRSRGLQVILVTHERSLGHLFDKVIDLSMTA